MNRKKYEDGIQYIAARDGGMVEKVASGRKMVAR